MKLKLALLFVTLGLSTFALAEDKQVCVENRGAFITTITLKELDADRVYQRQNYQAVYKDQRVCIKARSFNEVEVKVAHWMVFDPNSARETCTHHFRDTRGHYINVYGVTVNAWCEVVNL